MFDAIKFYKNFCGDNAGIYALEQFLKEAIPVLDPKNQDLIYLNNTSGEYIGHIYKTGDIKILRKLDENFNLVIYYNTPDQTTKIYKVKKDISETDTFYGYVDVWFETYSPEVGEYYFGVKGFNEETCKAADDLYLMPKAIETAKNQAGFDPDIELSQVSSRELYNAIISELSKTETVVSKI